MNKKQSLSGRLLWKCVKKLVLELILSLCLSPLASSPKFTDLLQLYSFTGIGFLVFFFFFSYLSYYLNSFFYYSVLLKRVITFNAFTFSQTILFLQNLSPTPPSTISFNLDFLKKFFTCFVEYSSSAHLLMLALLSSAYLFRECGRRVLHSDWFASQYTPHLEAVSFAPRILIVTYTLRSSTSLSASRCHFSTLEMYFCFLPSNSTINSNLKCSKSKHFSSLCIFY